MFRMDVAKVDQDVAYVVIVGMLQTSIPNVSSIFQTYVASVFIWMLPHGKRREHLSNIYHTSVFI